MENKKCINCGLHGELDEYRFCGLCAKYYSLMAKIMETENGVQSTRLVESVKDGTFYQAVALENVIELTMLQEYN